MVKHYKSPRKTDAEGEELAERLKGCREAFDETQVQFAKRFRISEFTYLRWEKYGPPKTMAHREYVRMMLQKLARTHAEKKRATAAKNARVERAAD